MQIEGKKFVVVGGAGLIGSHTVDRLLREDVGEVVVYDNFVRGSMENSGVEAAGGSHRGAAEAALALGRVGGGLPWRS